MKQEEINELLFDKCHNRKWKDVKELIVNHNADVSAQNHEGKTPLHVALRWSTYKHCLGTVRALLDNGADIEARDPEGKTPLHLAINNCRPNVINEILERGADIHAVDNKGRTTLHAAMEATRLIFEKEAMPIIEKLIISGVDTDLKDINGKIFTEYRPHNISEDVYKKHTSIRFSSDEGFRLESTKCVIS